MGFESVFPAVDPIPLPAPVWLFKVLHTVTLVLHFFAVHLLLGGLTLATIWAIWGRFKRDEVLVDASGAIVSRLPIVMTYVVNLGVPPLLFAQVLYGRALYTSSVLIGAWWISVVVLLMVSYALLYYMASRANSGRSVGWLGFIALLAVVKIGGIYTGNMSLMIRPHVWLDMYRAYPTGVKYPSDDPTTLPRFLYMMLGSIGISGLALLFLALKSGYSSALRAFWRRWGGRMLATMVLLQAGAALWVFRTEPDAVRAGVSSNVFYTVCAILWAATGALLILGGAAVSLRIPGGWLSPSLLGLVSFLNVSAMVLYRDGIRDVALGNAGYIVWDRAVHTNWSTVILFVILFVAALIVVGWLISVVAKAKPVEEKYAIN